MSLPPFTPFCTDVDLLHWEPSIMKDAAWPSQTLLAGTGTLSGTSFAIDAGSLADVHVQADHVIAIGAPLNGSFPIVSIESASALTLSVLYDGLFPGESDPPVASPAGAGTSLPFAIRTFWPQRRVVSELLLGACGIDAGDPSQIAAILNPQALRRACTLGTLQMIYSALAATSSSSSNADAVRAALYERLYRGAMRSVQLDLDLDGDGIVDRQRALNVVTLRRG